MHFLCKAFALSYRNVSLQCYSREKRAYEERVMEIEHGSLTPLCSLQTVGWGKWPNYIVC